KFTASTQLDRNPIFRRVLMRLGLTTDNEKFTASTQLDRNPIFRRAGLCARAWRKFEERRRRAGTEPRSTTAGASSAPMTSFAPHNCLGKQGADNAVARRQQCDLPRERRHADG